MPLELLIPPSAESALPEPDDVLDGEDDDEDDDEDDEDCAEDPNGYEFDALSEQAKEHARDEYRCDSDNRDQLDDMFENLFEYYGIRGATIACYQLSYCQGDHVAFKGSWTAEEFLAASDPSKDDRDDRLSTSEPILRLRAALQKVIPLCTFITLRATESRDWTSGDVEYRTLDEDEVSPRLWLMIQRIEPLVNEVEEAFEEVCRMICDWLLKAGHEEVDFLNSDENIDEALSDCYRFTREGELIPQGRR